MPVLRKIIIYALGKRREYFMDIKTPFRYDHVGSFLRPEYLKQARAEFFDGKITREELTAVENKAITELVKKQKELGYHAITDGEFRRGSWHLDFMWAFDGVSHSATDRGLPFHDEAAILDDTYLTGKVGRQIIITSATVKKIDFISTEV